MTKRFIDQVALVTGGGSGIGRATAQALAAEGATVVVAGRTGEPLEEVVEAIAQRGGDASAVAADVTAPEDVQRLIATTVERHARLDVAVNNAGILEAGPLAEMPHDAWQRLIATNLTGTFLCMKHEIRHMRQHGGGAIVNVASTIGAHVRIPTLAAYAASKAAVSALTAGAARECIADGIRINAISPGPSDTPMSLQPGETTPQRDARLRTALPIGRVGALDEIASAVLFAASPQAAFIVGHDLVVDGGASA
jgi:NAD(P)-dependent dehydrogenase (short-subunit alcohol dehydrogenase family)